MRFHEELAARTGAERRALVATPIIQGAMRGEVSVPSYVAFLTEAWHHVRHTVPLLAACRDAMPAHLDWMRPALEEYVEEERGHDDWILDDIRACGGSPAAVRASRPAAATEIMVAYAYDTIARGNPIGFLGMVHVLEGTSAALALHAADRIQGGLGLTSKAFRYLRSHGTLDQQHTAHFADLVDRLDDERDREALVHAARIFCRLYADVFGSLPLPGAVRPVALGTAA